MTSSKCKTSKSKSRKKKTGSSTSRTKWTKKVEYKLDGGTITSWDKTVGKYHLHVWQMYGPGNKWNWLFKDTSSNYSDFSGGWTVMQSEYNGEKDWVNALDRCDKAFIWYLTMRLLRDSDDPKVVLKGLKDV